jgi:hypothetical protein
MNEVDGMGVNKARRRIAALIDVIKKTGFLLYCGIFFQIM